MRKGILDLPTTAACIHATIAPCRRANTCRRPPHTQPGGPQNEFSTRAAPERALGRSAQALSWRTQLDPLGRITCFYCFSVNLVVCALMVRERENRDELEGRGREIGMRMRTRTRTRERENEGREREK